MSVCEKIDIGHAKYRLMNEVVDFLVGEDCTIFGGWIRDKIIHDHYADLFYGFSEGRKAYSDPTIHPESVLRLTYPKDIDVYKCGTKEDIHALITKMTEHTGLHAKIVGGKGQYQIFEGVFVVKCYLSVTKCLRNSNLFSPLRFSVDFVYSEIPQVPPFGKLDYLCNGFLLTKQGLSFTTNGSGEWGNMSGSRFTIKRKIENKIIGQILQKKTRKATISVDSNRERKMLKKDWKIFDHVSHFSQLKLGDDSTDSP